MEAFPFLWQIFKEQGDSPRMGGVHLRPYGLGWSQAPPLRDYSKLANISKETYTKHEKFI